MLKKTRLSKSHVVGKRFDAFKSIEFRGRHILAGDYSLSKTESPSMIGYGEINI